MNRITFTTLAFLSFLSVARESFAQQNALITTKRDFPIGMVSFGSSVISGVLGDGNFVDGYVKKTGTGAFVYPVGDNGALRPFAASQETTGAYFGVDPGIAITNNPIGGNYGVLPAEGPFNSGLFEPALQVISKKEYWDINGSEQTKITLTWNSGSDLNTLLGTKDISKLTIVGWNGTRWIKIPSIVDPTSIIGGASNKTSGSITTTSSLVPDNFNVYSLGALQDGTLPVTLVRFTAQNKEQQAHLEWITSSEINSSHFDIERSLEGKSWVSIGTVAATGDPSLSGTVATNYEFTDTKPFSGLNFYRLKMVDLDETYAYSAIRKVEIGSNPEIAFYPNPASDRLFVTQNDPDKVKEVNLTDLKGNAVYRGKSFANQGIDVSQLPRSIYVINMMMVDGSAKTAKVLVGR
ncbi:T9SS type A sorting domain-containing protein [Dyadobacter sp. CY323]|uniref:T9SS type A sorting domain-containing protein n=1 Tax=Dyadobacter sp. CY323 TaxID=2907302 RepID=UPI001F2164F1|nr:T9SS type A sorting domain-containing protein [Dyadobacter sp. CY323]MCE6991322.1 T9SS type A sorting domain-containing protein [Dyadobacter sp. CY323]